MEEFKGLSVNKNSKTDEFSLGLHFDDLLVSDESDQDEDRDIFFDRVPEKVDGLDEFQQNLPLVHNDFEEILRAKNSIKEEKIKSVYKKLKDYFRDDQAWRSDLDPEINFEKFFSSGIFTA